MQPDLRAKALLHDTVKDTQGPHNRQEDMGREALGFGCLDGAAHGHPLGFALFRSAPHSDYSLPKIWRPNLLAGDCVHSRS